MTKRPCPSPVIDPDWPDPRHPPRDPDFPLIWGIFKTAEQVERWLTANKKNEGEPGRD
jgi:hypothetical protein